MRRPTLSLLLPLLLAAGEPPRGTLKGHLDGPDGKPAAGASLLLISGDGATARGATSARSGFFVFPALPGGRYRLLARQGDRAVERTVTVRAPFAADERVTLGAPAPVPASGGGAPATLSVTCLAGDATVPGARIFLLAADEARSTGAASGADGAAALATAGGPVRLAVEATGFRLFETPPFIPRDRMAVEIQLVPDSTDFPFEPRSHLPPAQLAAAIAAAPASAPR